MNNTFWNREKYSSDASVRAQQRGEDMFVLMIFVVRLVLIMLALRLAQSGNDGMLVLAALILTVMTPPIPRNLR